MKLRNKKTGEIGEPRVAYQEIYVDTTEHKTYCYKSIAGLNEEWEDYTPKEPLIKDPKIRKVVRAWAEINTFEPDYSVKYDSLILGLTSWQADINFNFPLKELEGGKEYTIEELCGEEEECEN